MAAGDLSNILSGNFTKTSGIFFGMPGGTLGTIKEVYVGHNGEAKLIWKLSDTPTSDLEWGVAGAIVGFIPETDMVVNTIGMCADSPDHSSIYTCLLHETGVVVGFTNVYYDMADKDVGDTTGHVITVKFTDGVPLKAGHKYYLSLLPIRWTNTPPKFAKYKSGDGEYISGIMLNNFTPVVVDISAYNYAGKFRSADYPNAGAATMALISSYNTNDMILYVGESIGGYGGFGGNNNVYYRNNESAGTVYDLQGGTLVDAFNKLAMMDVGDVMINDPPSDLGFQFKDDSVYKKTVSNVEGKVYKGSFNYAAYSDQTEAVNALVSMAEDEYVIWACDPMYWPYTLGSKGTYYIRNGKNPYAGAYSEEPSDVVLGDLYYKTSSSTKWNDQSIDRGFYAFDGTAWTAINVATLFDTASMKSELTEFGLGGLFTKITNNSYMLEGTYKTDAKYYLEINGKEF